MPESMTAPNPYRPAPDLLAGRVVLVTGAGDGLGRAAARAYARHGASVILLGRTVSKLESVYDEILAGGGLQPAITPMDLARATSKDYDILVAAIDKEFGRLDGILHSAAELGNLTPLELYDPELWTQVMHVNFNAAYVITRLCLDLLRRSNDASVIFSSSDVARHARAYWGAYAAAGGALERLMETWADELEHNTHIRLNSLDPGAVATGLRARAYPGEIPDQHPRPEEVMAPYLYLMGPDSRGTTGHAFSAR
ncbi:MAG: YciK family oxidoreductase [Acidiferrobacterales bacterium]